MMSNHTSFYTQFNKYTFLLLICWISATFKEVWAGEGEVRLINDLLRDYNMYERPARIDNEPLVVEFLITLQQIMDLDEKNQVINTNLWLNMRWSDYKLAWDPLKYNNITEIRLPRKILWKPDILMYNSADPAFDGSWPVNMVIYSDGTIEQLPPGIFTSSCPINIRWFPFDVQSCPLKFGSWTYDGTKIDLKVMGGSESGSVDGYRKSGEWDLISLPVTRNVVLYDCCPNNPYIDITFNINIRRRKLYYLVNIVLPCVMLAALTLLTFTIPCEAGEKISFGPPEAGGMPDPLKLKTGVTILLSLTVFLLMVAEALPATSDAVPVVAIYFSCVMLMNSASVCFTVLVLCYHHRTANTHTMPKIVKYGINVWLAWLMRMSRPEKNLDSVHTHPNNSHSNNNHRMSRDVKMELHEYTNMASRSLMSNIRGDDDDYSLPSSPQLNGHDLRGKKGLDSPTLSASLEFSPLRCDLRSILRETRFITDRMKKKQEDDQVLSDWKFASAVLDRFFLWFFFIFILICSCGVLMTVPGMFDHIDAIG